MQRPKPGSHLNPLLFSKATALQCMPMQRDAGATFAGQHKPFAPLSSHCQALPSPRWAAPSLQTCQPHATRLLQAATGASHGAPGGMHSKIRVQAGSSSRDQTRVREQQHSSGGFMQERQILLSSAGCEEVARRQEGGYKASSVSRCNVAKLCHKE